MPVSSSTLTHAPWGMDTTPGIMDCITLALRRACAVLVLISTVSPVLMPSSAASDALMYTGLGQASRSQGQLSKVE